MRWFLSRRSRRLAEAVVSVPSGHHRFDDTTGQMYTETTSTVLADNDRNWPRRIRDLSDVDYTLPPRSDTPVGRAVRLRDMLLMLKRKNHFVHESSAPRRGPKEKGARSLADIALETALRNTADITLDLLEGLPIQLLQRIWAQINKRQLLSFHAWLVFCALLRGEDSTLRMLRYREQIKEPKSPLYIYTDPLVSKSFEFITYISITTAFPIPELVKLSALKNLGALEIINDDGPSQRGVSDRLIRAWSIAAESDDAFQVLRILKLWKHAEVTHASLNYLNLFPALALYDVTGCGDFHAMTHSRDLGWKATIDPNLLGLFEAACVERATVMRASLGKESRAIRKVFAQQLSDGAPVRFLPRAEVPAFLSRDEATIRRQPPEECRKYDDHNNRLDYLQRITGRNLHIRERRFNLIQEELLIPSQPLETWDFPVYTTFCKIGELRNDSDLARAGVNIGDQPLVENELICPVPIVSLRVGPSPACLRSVIDESVHKSFYEGSTPSSEELLQRFTHDWTYDDRRIQAIKAQRLAFIRIKVAHADMSSASENQGVDSARETPMSGPVKRPSSAGSSPITSQPVAKRRSIGMERKKKSLGDLLGSLLP